MMSSMVRCIVLLVWAPVLLCGCAASWPAPLSAQQAEKPHLIVVHLPGIGGIEAHDLRFSSGLRDAGIEDVRKFDWTGTLPLANLTDQELHRRKAGELAEQLRSLHRQQPSHRIVLTAHSAGTRVAVLAVAELGEHASDIVEQLWLIAPALDPRFDLTPTLDAIPRVVSVHSSGDWLILGLGTRLFGTADRHYGEAAGFAGFEDSDPRLESLEYGEFLRDRGARSDHLGALRRCFARDFVGPSILDWTPSPIDPPRDLEAPPEGNRQREHPADPKPDGPAS